MTGGLGPTDDDLTRDAVAAAVGRPLDRASGHRRAHRRAVRAGAACRCPTINRRQAQVLEGAVVLANPNGTAPGSILEHGEKVIVLLPGPPRELQPMLNVLCERSARRAGRARTHLPDQSVRHRPGGVARRGDRPAALFGVARPKRRADRDDDSRDAGPDRAAPLAAVVGRRGRGAAPCATRSSALAAALGADVFSVDGRPMEELVGAMLRERHLTIAAAESCTGGLMMSRLTDVPGSSEYVVGGLVLYSNELKTKRRPGARGADRGARRGQRAGGGRDGRGVREPHGRGRLRRPSPASRDPAAARRRSRWARSCIAVLVPAAPARVRTSSLFGNRTQVKFNAAQAALDMVAGAR